MLRNNSKSICQTCQVQFENISEDHCLGCYRQGTLELCLDCQKWKKKGHSVKNEAIFKYNTAMKDYFSKYKFQGDYRLKDCFAQDIKKVLKKYKGFALVPIPISKERMRERQFNQVHGLLDGIKIPYQDILLRLDDEKQSSKTKLERHQVRNRFFLREEEELPDNILIIDDIYTTGSTLWGVYQLLYENGAKNVKSFTLAR